MLFKSRPPPKRFRKKRKKHEITCGKCGKKDNVDFHPKGIGPVLCTKCYKKAKAKGKK
ncbi:CxxC-x17-CxxC domain-containing protein [Candidatus Aenigmatarchaeota archaeon]